jgi:hypothetical protein
MEFTLIVKIKVENSIFDVGAGYEIMHLVNAGIQRERLNIATIEKGDSPFKDTEPLIDTNGNKVGTIEIEVTE